MVAVNTTQPDNAPTNDFGARWNRSYLIMVTIMCLVMLTVVRPGIVFYPLEVYRADKEVSIWKYQRLSEISDKTSLFFQSTAHPLIAKALEDGVVTHAEFNAIEAAYSADMKNDIIRGLR